MSERSQEPLGGASEGREERDSLASTSEKCRSAIREQVAFDFVRGLEQATFQLRDEGVVRDETLQLLKRSFLNPDFDPQAPLGNGCSPLTLLLSFATLEPSAPQGPLEPFAPINNGYISTALVKSFSDSPKATPSLFAASREFHKILLSSSAPQRTLEGAESIALTLVRARKDLCFEDGRCLVMERDGELEFPINITSNVAIHLLLIERGARDLIERTLELEPIWISRFGQLLAPWQPEFDVEGGPRGDTKRTALELFLKEALDSGRVNIWDKTQS